MEKSSKISIYITSYNQRQYLVEAIESVLNQTVLPYEIIVIDDASIDGSQELISEYQKKYPDLIKPVFHKINLGISKSRNEGLSNATGNYITYLDGDDYYLPSKIEDDYNAIKLNNDVDLIFSNYLNKTDDEFFPWVTKGQLNTKNIFRDTFSFGFPKETHFRNELIKKSLLDKVGYYDEKLQLWEDLDFRIRYTNACKSVVYINKTNSVYRRHSNGLGTRSAQVHVQTLTYVYKKNLNLLSGLTSENKLNAKKGFKRFLAELYLHEGVRFMKGNHSLLKSRYEGIKCLIKASKFQIRYTSFVLLALIVIPRRIFVKLSLINKANKN